MTPTRTHRRRLLLVASVALLGLLLAPSSQAALLPQYGFQMDIRPLSVSSGKASNETDINFTLLTGEATSKGEARGLFGFVESSTGSLAGAAKIEVINPSNKQGAIARARSGQCTSSESCFVERTYTNADLLFGKNASLLLYADTHPINHSEDASFAVASLLSPLQQLGQGAMSDLTVGNSLLLVGKSLHAQGRFANPTDDLYVYMTNPNSTVTVQCSAPCTEPARSYADGQFVFRVYGSPVYDVAANGLLIPFEGDASAHFRPGPRTTVRDQFQPEALNGVVKSLGSNSSVVSPEVAKGLQDFAPILNGVFVGRATGPVINQKDRDAVDLAIVRFPSLEMVPSTQGATIQGKTDFLLMGKDGFYTTKSGSSFGPLKVPPLSFFLWLLACAAIILGFVLRPILSGPQLGAFGSIRLLGIVFHALAFLVAFLLWDNEIRGFLGTSLVALFTQNAFGHGTVLVVTGFFQLVTFGVASLLFGMPVRFLVNSGLKFGGLKKARGVGKGVGNLAVWGLGAPFIPFILNGFVGALLSALQKAVGGG